MLIAVGSLKGRGSTAVAVGLAASWPEVEVQPLVIELDPEGGDIALGWQMRPDPGLADVAAALASNLQNGPGALHAGTQTITVAGVAVPVVCAGPGGRGVRKAMPLITGSNVLHDPDGVAMADLGRLYTDSVAWSVAEVADVFVCVLEGTLAQAAHLRARIEDLTGLARRGTKVGIVVIEHDYRAFEVEEMLLGAGLEADLELRVLGGAGPADLISAESRSGRAVRRGHRQWRRLAEAARDFATTPPPTLTAALAADDREAVS
jgi:hypothetical protein